MLQREVEAWEHQVGRLVRSSEETTATLQYTITQRDRRIAKVRGIPAGWDREKIMHTFDIWQRIAIC